MTPARGFVISTFIERTYHATHREYFAGLLGCLYLASAGSMLPRLLHPFGEFSLMDMNAAIVALGALAGEPRLALFRLLVQAGSDGLAAGTIAEKLRVPNSSLSFHLAQLRGAGLISQERQHRLLIYRANYPTVNALVDYLTENCCEGVDCAPVGLSSRPSTQAKRKFV